MQGVGKRHCEKRYPYSRLLRAIGKFVYAKYRSSVLYALNPSNLKKRDFAPDFTLDFAYASFNEEKWVSASFVCDPKSRNVYLLLKKCREYNVVLSRVFAYCTTAPMSSEVLERAASVSRSSSASLWARSTAASVLAASAS